MAEKAFKKFEDQLNCPVCLDTYTHPKQLDCHHVYCQQCLTRLVIRDQRRQLVICPNCRQVTPIPASGVAGLQTAFQINQFVAIVKEHKTAEDTTASAERTSLKSTTVGCPQHGGRQFELFCYTCGEPICCECIVRGENHHSHDYEVFDELFENYTSLEPMLVATRKALAAVGKKSTALLQAKNHPTSGDLCITCELVSELTGTRVGGTVERRGEKHYKISYQPTIKGRHQLHIKVDGQDIMGSPFPVAVSSPVEKLGTPILTICGEMRGPQELAINQRGEVVVNEKEGGRVSLFSPKGEKLRSLIGTHGASGVAVDGKGCILVTTGPKIQKFSAEGEFLTAVGIEGSKQAPDLCGIAYNPSNDTVYVGESDRDRIHILNSDLSYIGEITCSVEEESMVGDRDTMMLACSSTGDFYTAYYQDPYIRVFSSNGKFLRKIGGDLWETAGVAVDCSGRVYTSSLGSGIISVFSSAGQLLTSFGEMGSGPVDFDDDSFGEAASEPGQFDGACGVAVDNSGVVYVCDYFNKRVQAEL